MWLLIACVQAPSDLEDSAPEVPTRSADATLTVSTGSSASVEDPDGAEGPGRATDAGHIEQAIFDIRESLLGDHIEIGMEGIASGIGPGDTCHDFDNQVESTGGCDWWTIDGGSMTTSGGETIFTDGEWTDAGGTLEVTGLRTDDDGTFISFEFEMALVKDGAEASLTGSVSDARLTD